MATAKRYQSNQPRQAPRGVDPFSYARGIQTPAAPTIPMPPSPAGAAPPAPPGPPHIYEPRITPAEQRMKGAIAQASQLSKILGAWGDRFYKQAEVEAEASGTHAGLQAGLAGEYEMRTGGTIYDQAFNTGAFEAYKGQVRMDAKSKIRDFALQTSTQHNGDVGVFDTLVDNYAVSTLKEQSDNPKLQAFTKHKIAEYSFEYRTSLLKERNARDKQIQIETFHSDVNDQVDDLTIAIRSGDKAMSANRLLEIQASIDAGVAAGHITGKEAATKFQNIKDEAMVIEHLREFEGELASSGLPLTAGWIAYEEFKFNNPDKDMPADVKARIEQSMVSALTTQTQRNDRVDRLARAKVDEEQTNNFIAGLEQHFNGTLTEEGIAEKLRLRKISPDHYTTLSKLLGADLKEIEANINRINEYGIWVDIHDGLDSEEEKQKILSKITGQVANGLSAGVAKQMLEVVTDPNYQNVTKNADYQLAVQQINIDLGRASGPLASYEEGTATTVAAALRELYVRSSQDEKPLDIVNGIITRGKIKLERSDVTDPGLLPRYSAWHTDGSYDVQGSNVVAEAALTDGAITWEEFHDIYEKQRAYWRFITEKPANLDDQAHFEKLEAERAKRIEEELGAGVAGRK